MVSPQLVDGYMLVNTHPHCSLANATQVGCFKDVTRGVFLISTALMCMIQLVV